MNRISELRNAKKMSQEDLGSIIGCTGVTIGRYENGRRQLDPQTIDKLCDLFGCTSDYLLGRSSSPYATVSDADAELIKAYHAASDRDRSLVDQILFSSEEKEKSAVS